MRTAAAGYPLRLSSGGQLPSRRHCTPVSLLFDLHRHYTPNALLCQEKAVSRQEIPGSVQGSGSVFFKNWSTVEHSSCPRISRCSRAVPASLPPWQQNAGRTGRTGKRGEAEQRRTRGEQVIRQHGNTSGQARGQAAPPAHMRTRHSHGVRQRPRSSAPPRHPIHAARRAGT